MKALLSVVLALSLTSVSAAQIVVSNPFFYGGGARYRGYNSNYTQLGSFDYRYQPRVGYNYGYGYGYGYGAQFSSPYSRSYGPRYYPAPCNQGGLYYYGGW